MGKHQDPGLIKIFNDRYTPEPMSGCWLWMGSVGNQRKKSGRLMSYGYIVFKQEKFYAHRLSYLINTGNIDPGNHVHHKCENTLCVNPTHLKQLTPADHVALTPGCAGHNHKNATHCKNGHPLELRANRKNPHRVCLICDRARSATYKKTKHFDRFAQQRSQRNQNAEKTHCSHGHEYTESNTKWLKVKSGWYRYCVACKLQKYIDDHNKPRQKCTKPIPEGKRCPAGHLLNEDNAYAFGNNSFRCWICKDAAWEESLNVRRANK